MEVSFTRTGNFAITVLCLAAFGDALAWLSAAGRGFWAETGALVAQDARIMAANASMHAAMERDLFIRTSENGQIDTSNTISYLEGFWKRWDMRKLEKAAAGFFTDSVAKSSLPRWRASLSDARLVQRVP
jgi:hypothetical protein